MNHIQDQFVNLTLIFTGSILAIFGLSIQEFDFYIGFVLKVLSCISFFIMIVINMPKFYAVVKKIFRNDK
jgi:hypothetical protein